jgi:sugar O-acyltransferase (sialic acid O-acetyltransferase NeuD family)
MREILIYGAGGFGMEVAWLIEDINRVMPTWNLIGFIDEDEKKWGQKRYGYPVIGGPSVLERLPSPHAMAVAIGDSNQRRSVVERLRPLNLEFPALIHPSVIMSRTVTIAEGVVVAAGSVLTVEIEIGPHTHLNLDCTVGHGAVVGEYSTLFPSVNVSGDVELGHATSIGTGAAIIQSIKIGANTVVGAGAVVVRDLPDNVVAVGNPARVIKTNAAK